MITLYPHMPLFRHQRVCYVKGRMRRSLPPSNHIYARGGSLNKDRVTWMFADSYWIILMRQIQNEDDISKSKNGLSFLNCCVVVRLFENRSHNAAF